MAPRIVAAIDIGTVTTRLLVAEVGREGVRELVRSTDITHLGEDLTRTGRLSVAAMDRVESVVERYASRLAAHHVDTVRAIATSASRDAENSAEFQGRLARHGVSLEVVAGDVEARLAFSGATWGLSGPGVLVNDIGGGSTEVILGDAGAESGDSRARIEFARSVDVGSRRATELFLPSDPPSAGELAAAREWIGEQLGPVAADLPSRPGLSIALAGTATTLSAIDQGLAEYDSDRVHGSVLTLERIDEMTAMLAGLPLERRRREVVGLDAGRAPVIVSGALILGELLRAVGLDSTTVSEHDILYGIVLELAGSLQGGGESGL